METLRGKKGFICDMDGVIYHGNRLLPGVKEFVAWLYRENKNFLFLTNSSEHSPKELQRKLERMGLEVDESHFYTSALATARFISSQAPGCSAYVIGGAGLIMALHDEGITMNDIDPDYVIIGEGNTYNYENILRAVHLVLKGAKLIGTNSDLTGPSEDGIIPACRAMISPIEMATGQNAYFVGKPNPLMMRTGLRILGVHSEEAHPCGLPPDGRAVHGAHGCIAGRCAGCSPADGGAGESQDPGILPRRDLTEILHRLHLGLIVSALYKMYTLRWKTFFTQ